MVWVELKRVLKEAGIILLLTAALLVYIATTQKNRYIASVMMEFFLLLYSSYSGWSMFDRERQENAVEYLLSMPASRTRLLLMKIAPRVLSVAVMLVIYLQLHDMFEINGLLASIDFAIFYMAFFLISASFSITSKSFIGTLFITVILSVGLTYLLFQSGSSSSYTSSVLTANLVLMAFPITFFILFHTFDMKPSRTFNIRLMLPLFIFTILVAAFTWLGTGVRWNGYYLAANGNIIRASCNNDRGQWIDTEKEKYRELKGNSWPVIETGGGMILQYITHLSGGNHRTEIAYLDLKDYSSRPILNLDGGWRIDHGYCGYNGVIRSNIYYGLLFNEQEKLYKIVSIPFKEDEPEISEIPLYGEVPGGYDYQLFLITENPRQYIFRSRDKLCRTLESGETKIIQRKIKGLATWNHRVLVSGEQGITLYEVSETFTPVLTKKGRIRILRRRGGTPVMKEVLVGMDKKIFLFDIESMDFSPVDIQSLPLHWVKSGDIFHLVWAEGDNLSYGRLMGNKAVELRKWPVHIPAEHAIRGFPNGIIVHNLSKDYQCFLFDKN